MRVSLGSVAASAVVLLVGAAGLVRGWMPEHASAGTSQNLAPIVVTGAYVRAPVPPVQEAAGYFTVRNNTSTPDRLTDVVTGAGAVNELHVIGPDGSMSAAANGVVIPAHGTLALSTGKGHVMIEQLYGTLKAGQTVNMELDFQRAGSIDLVAPVIAVGAPVPVGGHS